MGSIKNFLHTTLIAFAALTFVGPAQARNDGDMATVALTSLPIQAQQTMSLIKRGGPFPYAQDGAVFGNYEKQLPRRERGYYREFTVRTPAARNRGVRRIIAGGSRPPFREYFYTDDHYASFKQIDE